MKAFDLGQTVSILANVGVIAGIIFLAVEIDQNNELLTAQAQASRLGSRSQYLESVYQNTDVLQTIVRAKRNEKLTDEDRLRLSFMADRLFVAWQFAYGAWRDGAVDQGSLPIDSWVRDLRGDTPQLPRLKELWDEQKGAYDPDFVEWVNENLIPRVNE